MSKEIYNKTEEEIMFTAYIKQDNKEGFIQLEWGQGECLIFLTDELEEADLFNSEDQILAFLQNENYKYDDIKFVERVKTKNVKYSIIK